MNDLPLTAATAWGSEPGSPAGSNLPEYTVSELSLALKRSIEDGFAHVRVRGEISGWKRVGSGHCYFALKDAEAVLDAVCWRTTAIRLALKPEDGMEVVCGGRLTTYPGRSKYQLIVDTVELAGRGALLKLLEDRRRRLAAEGLFAAERKRKLPFLPDVIGIVTSPTGAVIRDILHRLADRFPRRVLLWPVAVQGEGAAAQVAAAIAGLNGIVPGGPVPRPDLIIVARGGGSLEDLMAFNEEIVVRAAAASAIPLISAVGHETDTTLIDHASDRRAPTPSAAAEIAVPVRLDLVADLGGKGGRLAGSLARLFGERWLRLDGLARGLPDPHDLLGAATQRLDDRSERLRLAIAGRFAAARQRLGLASAGLRPTALAADIARSGERLGDVERRLATAAARTLAVRRDAVDNFAGRLATHSERHESLLARGYVVVRDAAERVVTAAVKVRPNAALELEFYDGKVGVIAGGSRRPVRRKRSAEGQISLFDGEF
jgi:exodeoxyribonuclease VII large subunit